jgi:hypothetical protein
VHIAPLLFVALSVLQCLISTATVCLTAAALALLLLARSFRRTEYSNAIAER